MNINAPRTRIFNLWDPEIASDYQMKYGVLQTPRMFLIDKEGIIIGRGLDSDALERLLDIVLPGFVDYEYGSAASAALMDELFASYDDTDRSPSLPKRPAPTRILSMAKALESSTLAKSDTLSFKHLEGDLLYWLTSRRDELSKEGALPFINEYILSRPGIWEHARRHPQGRRPCPYDERPPFPHPRRLETPEGKGPHFQESFG